MVKLSRTILGFLTLAGLATVRAAGFTATGAVFTAGLALTAGFAGAALGAGMATFFAAGAGTFAGTLALGGTGFLTTGLVTGFATDLTAVAMATVFSVLDINKSLGKRCIKFISFCFRNGPFLRAQVPQLQLKNCAARF
jgi:hypothetical protein